jgi:hypothetical protein
VFKFFADIRHRLCRSNLSRTVILRPLLPKDLAVAFGAAFAFGFALLEHQNQTNINHKVLRRKARLSMTGC